MNSSNRFKKEKEQRVLKICGIFTAILGIGCWMLFVVSRSFKPLLGNTFHILVGCVLIAVSSLVLIVTLKNHFFPKKKRKRSGVVFLEDELRRISKEKQSDEKP
jgi:hypothetical protein